MEMSYLVWTVLVRCGSECECQGLMSGDHVEFPALHQVPEMSDYQVHRKEFQIKHGVASLGRSFIEK